MVATNHVAGLAMKVLDENADETLQIQVPAITKKHLGLA